MDGLGAEDVELKFLGKSGSFVDLAQFVGSEGTGCDGEGDGVGTRTAR